MCIPAASFPAFEISPGFLTPHFCYEHNGEDSGKEHILGFLKAWAAQSTTALSVRSPSRSFSRKRPGLWMKMMMMMMQGRRVISIMECVILQTNSDCYACITSVTASDYEDERLQIRKCWNWGCKIAVVTWFICDCQNTLLVILVSASVSPLGLVLLSENAISQYFSSLCHSILDPRQSILSECLWGYPGCLWAPDKQQWIYLNSTCGKCNNIKPILSKDRQIWQNLRTL